MNAETPVQCPTTLGSTETPVWHARSEWRGGLRAAYASATGSSHVRNEDCCSHVPSADRPAFVGVADGVGGGAHGEIASSVLLAHCAAAPREVWSEPMRLVEWVARADVEVRKAIARRTDQAGAATLAAAWFVSEGTAHVVSVGDCRAYQLRPAKEAAGTPYDIQQLTIDQTYATLAQEPPLNGKPDDPARMVGAGAVGTPPVVKAQLRERDLLLLCSDGVHKFVPDAQIAAIVASGLAKRNALEAICNTLVSVAKANGSQDDASALLVMRRPWFMSRWVVGCALIAFLLLSLFAGSQIAFAETKSIIDPTETPAGPPAPEPEASQPASKPATSKAASPKASSARAPQADAAAKAEKQRAAKATARAAAQAAERARQETAAREAAAKAAAAREAASREAARKAAARAAAKAAATRAAAAKATNERIAAEKKAADREHAAQQAAVREAERELAAREAAREAAAKEAAREVAAREAAREAAVREAHAKEAAERAAAARAEKLAAAREAANQAKLITARRARASGPPPRFGTVFRDCPECPELVWLPQGESMLGDAPDNGRMSATIDYMLAVGRFEVTFAEWDACVAAGACRRNRDSGWGRGRQPVIDVSWADARQYTTWLSRRTGKNYRLLTEAEWEYAARAGTDARYWWGNEARAGAANCNDCGTQWDGRRPSPVGSFAPNPFGLHDMHGNVWEWVADCAHSCYARDAHIIRGGAWQAPARAMRSAARAAVTPGFHDNRIGFRVARTE